MPKWAMYPAQESQRQPKQQLPVAGLPPGLVPLLRLQRGVAMELPQALVVGPICVVQQSVTSQLANATRANANVAVIAGAFITAQIAVKQSQAAVPLQAAEAERMSQEEGPPIEPVPVLVRLLR